MANETKKEKFIRLAEARTNKIISMIRLLGNCSNTRVYEYNSKDVKKIFDAIDKELKMAKTRFDLQENSDDTFSL
ncbi:hypothetical protein SAMN02910413_1141 [Pseudobutyrivibrio sp. C4]|uniref:hypothetical protein n=1 Tax=Pseudobutyrivibrio sp. C4 TaxID=1520803 RepID=UPI0008B713A4|nr:hypothetical protein [Pseudobutyrivibrio sp. C4]SES89246.1 hypothetical protein SAMN02910413_1141 [Pseudobutyrivibrio sp. C4]